MSRRDRVLDRLAGFTALVTLLTLIAGTSIYLFARGLYRSLVGRPEDAQGPGLTSDPAASRSGA